MSDIKQEKNKEIAELLKQAMDIIKKAEDIANEHQLSFHWDLASGMGGYFVGAGQEVHNNWDRISAEDNIDGMWVSSSSGC